MLLFILLGLFLLFGVTGLVSAIYMEQTDFHRQSPILTDALQHQEIRRLEVEIAELDRQHDLLNK